jgi:hypothetical protein
MMRFRGRGSSGIFELKHQNMHVRSQECKALWVLLLLLVAASAASRGRRAEGADARPAHPR